MLKRNLWIIVLLVVFLIIGVAADVFFWQHIATQTQQQQSQWQTKADALSSQLATQQESVTALQNNLSVLQNKLTQFMMREQQNSTAQALNEIAYLLDIANLYLQINHDTADAIKSLQLAQHQLQAVADPSLLALQQALASDLNSLNDAPKVDAADILLKLQTLSESINRLTLHPQSTGSSAETTSKSTTNKQPWYKQSLQAFWINFKNLFVIRHNTNETPLVSSSNIIFTLAQAQWAVLQQKTALYQQSLTQVHQWLTEQYPDSSERQQILSRLEELSAIDIAPMPPDISASLHAVEQAIKELPLTTEPAANPVAKPQPAPATPTPALPAQPEKPNAPPAGVEI